MKTSEKVALNAIKQNSKSHIELNAEECARCADKICLRACPAELYTFEEAKREVIVDHSGCLECGTCMIVCPAGAVNWQYPGAGFGIRYRYG